jgi:lipid II:glycine glycyltransferase (peptidoglycan interpeptide bridge formation enzyme)
VAAETEQAKQAICAELKTIEDALKYLPEESAACRPARLDLLEKQAKLKQDSMHQRPLGTQLDGVQGALDRAVKRLQSAKDVAEEAKQNIVAEQANIAKLTAEKADIETKIKKSVGGSPASDTAELSSKLQAMFRKCKASLALQWRL